MKKLTTIFLLCALCLYCIGCSAQINNSEEESSVDTKNNDSAIFINDIQQEETMPNTGINELSEVSQEQCVNDRAEASYGSGTDMESGIDDERVSFSCQEAQTQELSDKTTAWSSEQASHSEEISDEASEESFEEEPTLEASDAVPSDNVSERSSRTDIIKPGTKKVSSALAEKYKFFSFSNIESEINHRFPALTQEQFDKMAEYIKTKNASGRPYDQAVAAGLVDPDAPKMTLEKMQTIIEDAKSNKELKDYVMVEYESEGTTYQFKTFAGKDCYFGYILDEALKIQPYFDYIIHESTNYMLTDEEGNQTGRIAIVFDTASPYIYYESFTASEEDGKIKILFDTAEQS